jgi:hypothetical protein
MLEKGRARQKRGFRYEFLAIRRTENMARQTQINSKKLAERKSAAGQKD